MKPEGVLISDAGEHRGRELILASGSPRRRDMLAAMGLEFRVLIAEVEEEVLPQEEAKSLALRLAEEKADFAAMKEPGALVIAADTVVSIRSGGVSNILGKPVDVPDARRMLRALQGVTHEVVSAYCLRCTETGLRHCSAVETLVTMRALSSEEIEAYISTGEPQDKAGAYGIQGFASAFVSKLEGSYTTVVGLPLAEIIEDLQRLGVWEPSLIHGRQHSG